MTATLSLPSLSAALFSLCSLFSLTHSPSLSPSFYLTLSLTRALSLAHSLSPPSLSLLLSTFTCLRCAALSKIGRSVTSHHPKLHPSRTFTLVRRGPCVQVSQCSERCGECSVRSFVNDLSQVCGCFSLCSSLVFLPCALRLFCCVRCGCGRCLLLRFCGVCPGTRSSCLSSFFFSFFFPPPPLSPCQRSSPELRTSMPSSSWS